MTSTADIVRLNRQPLPIGDDSQVQRFENIYFTHLYISGKSEGMFLGTVRVEV